MLCGLILTGTHKSASADIGTLVAAAETPEYRISVLALPTPVRVGPAVFNIAVRDRHTGQPVGGIGILLILTPPLDSGLHFEHQHGSHEIRARAQSNRRRHPGFSSALLDLSRAGVWSARIVVGNGARKQTVPFELNVAPPAPPWLNYWAAFGLPMIGLLIFIWHQRRVLGRHPKR